ncbi:MAG: isopentenyl phosphate kinase family protein [Chloroflexi bacterium]|nr:isopentenyl phosphate kinase family protein [Chloroflexota bacterium]
MSNLQSPISNPSTPLRTGLQFLKLGGSLITDKTRPRTPRLEVIARLADEIQNAVAADHELRLVIGHGAGSFAHVSARRHNTRQGVDSPEGWRGFAEVWQDASTLNHIVMEALHAAKLPAIALHPSAAVTARDGQVQAWDLKPLRAALNAGLLPVIHGDVIFDTARGGTILSTEDLFCHLARELHPRRILLAGLDEGVWADYPQCAQLIPNITPTDFAEIAPALGSSAGTDVTGGMASKVRQMLDVVEEIPRLEVLIFSGAQPKNVTRAIGGKSFGTTLSHHDNAS